jgi:hydroxymethylpyrimidine pyrophosphatase-like HAD family hydrolase
MQEGFGVELDAHKTDYAFIGDSPNDAPMFGYFPVAVGVANVVDFSSRLTTAPAYVTRARSGAGFVEFAEHLLRAC